MKKLALVCLVFCGFQSAHAQDSPCEKRWSAWSPVLTGSDGAVYIMVQYSKCLYGSPCGYPIVALKHTFPQNSALNVLLAGIECEGKTRTSGFSTAGRYIQPNVEHHDRGNWHLFTQVTETVEVDVWYEKGTDKYHIHFDKSKGGTEVFINGKTREQIGQDQAEAARLEEQKRSASQGQAKANYDEQIRRAKSFESSGNLTLALTAYEEALEINPGDQFAATNAQRLRNKLGTQAVDGRASDHRSKAQQLEREGKMDEALVEYEKALSEKPNDPSLRQDVARTKESVTLKKQSDDKRNRVERSNAQQQQSDAAMDQMVTGMGGLMSMDGQVEFFDNLGYGLDFGAGLSYAQVPLMENTYSTTNTSYRKHSSASSTMAMGAYLAADMWVVRNKYFGLGGASYVNLGFYSPTAGTTGTAMMYSFRGHLMAGPKKLKFQAQYGIEGRNGESTRDTDVVVASTISGVAPTGIMSEGSFDYKTRRSGIGLLFDFSNELDGNMFLSYDLLFDRPDFLPAEMKAIKVHKVVLRYYIDIAFYFGNNYPIAGVPKYTFDATDRNQNFMFVYLAKSFTIFHGSYKK